MLLVAIFNAAWFFYNIKGWSGQSQLVQLDIQMLSCPNSSISSYIQNQCLTSRACKPLAMCHPSHKSLVFHWKLPPTPTTARDLCCAWISEKNLAEVISTCLTLWFQWRLLILSTYEKCAIWHHGLIEEIFKYSQSQGQYWILEDLHQLWNLAILVFLW